MLVSDLLHHGLGRPFHVHQNIGDFQFGYGFEHLRIEFSPRYVVDHLYSVFPDTASGYIGTKCIDRNSCIGI